MGGCLVDQDVVSHVLASSLNVYLCVHLSFVLHACMHVWKVSQLNLPLHGFILFVEGPIRQSLIVRGVRSFWNATDLQYCNTIAILVFL